MKQFDTVEMASGGLALVLEPISAWEQFPAFAKTWSTKLNCKELSGPIITVDECLLEVEILGGEFYITYDDFQSSIQLEPREVAFNDIILKLQMDLKNDH
ncbi:MAG: hypothetical protein Q7R66_02350 [Undibacterium sp.]|uniref:hypothetical protein n=1 Tax=Undibacterium sp. TaxID=1914977 RepID=UPI0027289CDC|nr:hypothetical protein [Undibacterium sp.]MDO8651013.1 hypothetical protein [Undibacterium sp.]